MAALSSLLLKTDVAPELLDRYNRDHSVATVLEALETLDFPVSSRKNVRQPGQKTPVFGLCLGMTGVWHGPSVPSAATRQRPLLAKLLCSFAKHSMPGFEFTSIQVNKDYAAAVHVDKNNAGTSLITGLGDYTGGQLWVDNGTRFGKVVDLLNRWFLFDGNDAHGVLPFRGRRYTLVFFTRSSDQGGNVGEKPESKSAQKLLALNFPLPCPCPPTAVCIPSFQRVSKGSAKFEDFCVRTLKRGGPGRIRLRLRDSDGRVTHVAVLPSAPMQLLMDGLAQKFRRGATPMVSLRLGELLLLPGDTAKGLELSSRSIIDIELGSYQQCPDNIEQPLALPPCSIQNANGDQCEDAPHQQSVDTSLSANAADSQFADVAEHPGVAAAPITVVAEAWCGDAMEQSAKAPSTKATDVESEDAIEQEVVHISACAHTPQPAVAEELPDTTGHEPCLKVHFPCDATEEPEHQTIVDSFASRSATKQEDPELQFPVDLDCRQELDVAKADMATGETGQPSAAEEEESIHTTLKTSGFCPRGRRQLRRSIDGLAKSPDMESRPLKRRRLESIMLHGSNRHAPIQ